MDPSDVVDVVAALDDDAVPCWIDGGRGVDCLLGEQTRPHGDLDLVVPRRHLDRVGRLLAGRGYAVVRDWLPTALAWRDETGREVDLHVIEMTEDGGGDQVLLDGESTWHYAPPVDGSIGGRTARCSSAEEQVLLHQGYEPRAVDLADVRRLAERFGLRLTPGFDDFGGETSSVLPAAGRSARPHDKGFGHEHGGLRRCAAS